LPAKLTGSCATAPLHISNAAAKPNIRRFMISLSYSV
jgi:hypothetical protein